MRLRVALAQLAEQDPLFDVRQDDARHELSVSLYGEVQKEVIEATLSNEFGLEVTFRETTPIYIERPIGTGEAIESSTQNRIRISPRSDCAFIRRLPALGWISDCRSIPAVPGPLSMIETVLPTARAQDLQRQLPGLTGGEGVLDSSFAGYQPVSSDHPIRRWDDGESVSG